MYCLLSFPYRNCSSWEWMHYCLKPLCTSWPSLQHVCWGCPPGLTNCNPAYHVVYNCNIRPNIFNYFELRQASNCGHLCLCASMYDQIVQNFRTIQKLMMCHLRRNKNHLVLAPQQWWHIHDVKFDINISILQWELLFDLHTRLP